MKSEYKITEARFAAATIVHQGFIRFLPYHLDSISKAQKEYGKQINLTLFFSNYSNNTSLHKIREILKGYNDLSINLYATPEIYTCGAARNFILKRSKFDWNIFFDADVKVSKNYFNHLDKILTKRVSTDTKAIAGGIGSWEESRYGHFEAIMDIYAYYGKANSLIDIQDEYLQEYLWKEKNEYPAKVASIELVKINYLQGFNQIIHKDMLQFGGFDEMFFGAEDREMAAKIRYNGFQIILAPQCAVFHYYNFKLWDIIRRKYGHGYYSSMFRNKYRQIYPNEYMTGTQKWIKNFYRLLSPPKSFRSLYGLVYYHLSFWPYLFGSVVFNLERIYTRSSLFNFVYSKYSFAEYEEI